ncbi:MAG: hypothetical protein ACOC3C_07770 [Candidatus Thorarchaeota archaeon]
MQINTTFTRIWDGQTQDWKPERREDGFWPLRRCLSLQIMPWQRGYLARFELWDEYQDDREAPENFPLPYWQRKCRQCLQYWDFYDKDYPELEFSIHALGSGDLRGRTAEAIAHDLAYSLLKDDPEWRKMMPNVFEDLQSGYGMKRMI